MRADADGQAAAARTLLRPMQSLEEIKARLDAVGAAE
jgi:hypothetical protein